MSGTADVAEMKQKSWEIILSISEKTGPFRDAALGKLLTSRHEELTTLCLAADELKLGCESQHLGFQHCAHASLAEAIFEMGSKLNRIDTGKHFLEGDPNACSRRSACRCPFSVESFEEIKKARIHRKRLFMMPE
jgi:hypothetical protein